MRTRKPSKEYENVKRRVVRRAKDQKRSPKDERSVRFGNYNPDSTDSRVDG